MSGPRRDGPKPPGRWVRLQRARRIIDSDVVAFMDAHGLEQDPTEETWANDRYIVFATRDPEGWVRRLSIKRRDRRAVHDWRDMMRIKDEVAGPTVEAVELYPARDRLVDSANQYWLWCGPPGARLPFGFEERVVLDTGEGPDLKAVQRPFDPADTGPGGMAEHRTPDPFATEEERS